MPAKLSFKMRARSNYFLLQDESFVGEVVYIKTSLNKKQIRETVAYISLTFNDIVEDALCRPVEIAVFLKKYFNCELLESFVDISEAIDIVDLSQEKFKRIAFAYHFKKEYEEKNEAHSLKEEVYKYLALVLSKKRYLA